MTLHYGKSLKELTAEEVWKGACYNANYWSGTKLQDSFIPGAYGTFSEADHYAYDAWRYLEHLRLGGTKTTEEWMAGWEIADDEEKNEARKLYEQLLKDVVVIWKVEENCKQRKKATE